MTRDWKDGENSIFRFDKGSPQEVDFKLIKCGLLLQKLPKFSTIHASNLAANVSSSQLVTTPTSLALEMLLDNVPRVVRNNLNNESLMFLERYRQDFNFVGHQMCDKDFTAHITT